MKNKFNLMLKISIIINIILIFFGSYLGNLYIIQILGILPAIFACKIGNLKIKSDTKIWLIVILISIVSIVISIDKQSTAEVAALIIMALLAKIIYENNPTNWQKYFINLMFAASGIHVFATILQLLSPGFIEKITSIILGAGGLKTNQELYNVGAYAGITAQTSVNSFYIAIFVGIAFLKTLFEMEHKKMNLILTIIGIIALFLTGKRGMLLYTILSIMVIFIYTTYKDRKNSLKYCLFFLVVLIIGYITIMNIPQAKYIFDKISILEENSEVLNGRDILWKRSMETYKTNPILGIGLGSIQNIIGDYSHNIYIQLLAETGTVGFLIYIFAILGSFLLSLEKASKILKNKENKEKLIATFSIFVQIIFIIYGLTGNPLYGQMFLLPYIIAIAIINSIKIGEINNENRNNYIS